MYFLSLINVITSTVDIRDHSKIVVNLYKNNAAT